MEYTVNTSAVLVGTSRTVSIRGKIACVGEFGCILVLAPDTKTYPEKARGLSALTRKNALVYGSVDADIFVQQHSERKLKGKARRPPLYWHCQKAGNQRSVVAKKNGGVWQRLSATRPGAEHCS